MLRLAAFPSPLWSCAGPLRRRKLPVQPGFDTSPQVSPDGSWLLFQRFFGADRDTLRRTRRSTLPRADGSGGSRARRAADLGQPQCALDARQPRRGDPVRVGRDCSRPRSGGPRTGASCGSYPSPLAAWSPDGTGSPTSKTGPLRRPARRLAGAAVVSAPELGWIGTGEFSPDSTRLTYVVGLSNAPDRSEVVRIDGTDRHVLREAPVVAPGTWSPDGGQSFSWRRTTRATIAHRERGS